jgi:DNA-damage-inducible protein J
MEDSAMSTNAVVRARIDEDIKEEAASVLQAMGLSTSDAIRIMLTRVAREKALPFELLVPNEKTIKAMRAARRGNLEIVTLDELQAAIDADD